MFLCLLSMPVSGALAIGALVLRRFVSLPGQDLAEWAGVVVSNSYVIAQYGYVVAYVLPFLGFWALYTYMMDHDKVERMAFLGLVGALIGTGLALPTLGVFSYVSPAVGRLYLTGDSHLPQMITDIALGASMVLGLPAALLYAGGCLLLGVSVWKCSILPRWSGVILALHGFLLVFGFGVPLLLVVSWVLFFVSGGWLAWHVGRERSAVQ